MQPWHDTLAVLAAGAHSLGALVLLLLNPRSREVRWFSLFLGLLAAWLLLLSDTVAAPDVVQVLVARAFPAVFLVFALVVRWPRLSWPIPPAVIAGLIGAQFMVARAGGTDVVRLAVWIGGAILLWQSGRATRGRDSRWLRATLAAFAPVIVIVSMAGGDMVMRIILPLASIGMLLLVFAGIVRHRLYEIEVRVARSGALLTEAASHDRLALLGELAASFAHEIRNPLTGVRSLAQRLAEDDVPDEKRRRYAAVMVGEVERVEALVMRLLSLARQRDPLPAESLTDVALAPLLDDVALLVQGRAAPAGVELSMDGGGQVVHGSREGLAQVLLNLVLNAIAHSPAGGTVRCVASTDGGAVVLVVSDEGPGVEPGARERLFAPFESASGGSGLGLAVSRRLVEEMGGSIAVDDAPGGGARFAIRLARASASVAGHSPLRSAPHLATRLSPLGPGPHLATRLSPLGPEPHLATRLSPLGPGPHLVQGPSPLPPAPHLSPPATSAADLPPADILPAEPR